ncbi:hypothetical protein [Streptomyces sp. NPDC093260]|uniref:hypothetical protein n=1 Tax=Streptomyces sp. NPDC093260 TaxID=3155073 RepID=UPI00341BB2B6
MTKGGGQNPQRTDVKVSLIGGHRLEGTTTTLLERTVTASLIGADVGLTDIDIPGGTELRITKPTFVGRGSLMVRRDVRGEVHGVRLGGVKDDGPSEAGGPTVRIDSWSLLDGVTVHGS